MRRSQNDGWPESWEQDVAFYDRASDEFPANPMTGSMEVFTSEDGTYAKSLRVAMLYNGDLVFTFLDGDGEKIDHVHVNHRQARELAEALTGGFEVEGSA